MLDLFIINQLPPVSYVPYLILLPMRALSRADSSLGMFPAYILRLVQPTTSEGNVILLQLSDKSLIKYNLKPDLNDFRIISRCLNKS